LGERKAFLLRIDPKLLAALERWASDELRSINGQVEFLLRKSLLEAGRLKDKDEEPKGEEHP
jgi:hypothetical protein